MSKPPRQPSKRRSAASTLSKDSNNTPQRTGPDINLGCKHVLDKTTNLNDQLKERIVKITTQRKNEKDKPMQYHLEAEQRNWTNLMTKCQLAAYSANLLIHTSEAVDTMESTMVKAKNDYKKAMRENKELKASISFVIEKIYDTEGRIASAKEETLYWKMMHELSKIEYSMTALMDELAVWHEVKIYDVLWDSEVAGGLMLSIDPILVAVQGGMPKEAMNGIAALPEASDEELPTFATQIELVAKRCYEEGFFSEAETLQLKVIDMRIKVYGEQKPIVAASLGCLALIYAGRKNMYKATETTYKALDLLEKNSVTNKDTINLNRQFSRSGNLLVNWGYYQEGIKLMQLALTQLESKLPNEEQAWSSLICQMARACNDAKMHDDAMAIGCELIDYYHEKRFGPISDRNCTIYECAYAQQMGVSVGGETARMPDPVYLPAQVTIAMREVAISYACRFQFRAANIIKDYIERCANSCQEEPDALGSSAPQAFRDKERRKSIMPMEAKAPIHVKAPEPTEQDKKGLQNMFSNMFSKKK